MGIGNINLLPIFSFLPVFSAQAQEVAPSEKAPTIVCNQDGISSPSATLESVLASNQPQDISFGLIHPECSASTPLDSMPPTEIDYITDNFLPILKEDGIRDILFEYASGPEIDHELDTYYSKDGTAIIAAETPYLYHLTQVCDIKGFEGLLIRSKEMEMRVHLGGQTVAEIADPILAKEGQNDLRRGSYFQERRTRIIAQRLLAEINSLISPKTPLARKRIATISGMIHADRNPLPEYANYSFGDEIAAAWGDRYVEFDLLQRSVVTEFVSNIPQFYPPFSDYLRSTNPNVNSCYNPNPDHYVLMLDQQSP